MDSITGIYKALKSLMPDKVAAVEKLGVLKPKKVKIQANMNELIDPKVIESMSLLDLLSLLIQPSPADQSIDSTMEELVKKDASAADPDDPNRSVRAVLFDHLMQLRHQKRQMQCNIEQYVKVLRQVNDDERDAKKAREFYEKNRASFEQNEKATPSGAPVNREIGEKPEIDFAAVSKATASKKSSTEKSTDKVSANADDILLATKKLLETLIKDQNKKKALQKKKAKRRSSSSSSSDTSDDNKKRSSRRRRSSRKKRRGSRSRSKGNRSSNRSEAREESKYLTSAAPQFGYFDAYGNPPPLGATLQPYALAAPPPVIAAAPPVIAAAPPVTSYPPPGWPAYSAPPPAPPTSVPASADQQRRSMAADVVIREAKSPSAGRLPPAPPAGTRLSDVRSMYVKCARHDKWSKFLISSLKSSNDPEEKAAVFNELIKCDDLISDRLGCYVFKALFEVSNEQQMNEILQRLCMQFKNVFCTVSGSDLILTVIEKLGLEAATSLASELRTQVATAAKNINGVTVIEKLIDTVPSDSLKFVEDELCQAGVYNLSRHSIAHRVIDAVLKNFHEKHKEKLIKDLLPFVEQMPTDVIASGVLQTMIEKSNFSTKQQIIRTLSDEFLSLSHHKIANGVVRKCIEHASKEDLAIFVSALLVDYSPNCNNKFPLMDTLFNKFGCEVFKALLNRLEGTDPLEYARLLSFLEPHIVKLEKIPRLKGIIKKYYKSIIYADYPLPQSGSVHPQRAYKAQQTHQAHQAQRKAPVAKTQPKPQPLMDLFSEPYDPYESYYGTEQQPYYAEAKPYNGPVADQYQQVQHLQYAADGDRYGDGDQYSRDGDQYARDGDRYVRESDQYDRGGEQFGGGGDQYGGGGDQYSGGGDQYGGGDAQAYYSGVSVTAAVVSSSPTAMTTPFYSTATPSYATYDQSLYPQSAAATAPLPLTPTEPFKTPLLPLEGVTPPLPMMAPPPLPQSTQQQQQPQHVIRQYFPY